MTMYDIMEAERLVQAGAEQLAAREGFDWYGRRDEDAPRIRSIYRTRALAAIKPSLPDGHPWKGATI